MLIVSDRKPKPKQMIKQNVPVNVHTLRLHMYVHAAGLT